MKIGKGKLAFLQIDTCYSKSIENITLYNIIRVVMVGICLNIMWI
jgi:hypothetical protein